ncbi:MAG: DNA gyrase C-terminal beta-propeller domain-containing protein [Kouleothrix sp.]
MITLKLRQGDEVAAARVVYDSSLLTFITTGGTVMRCPADEVSQLGRATQGVTILNVVKGDQLAALG